MTTRFSAQTRNELRRLISAIKGAEKDVSDALVSRGETRAEYMESLLKRREILSNQMTEKEEEEVSSLTERIKALRQKILNLKVEIGRLRRFIIETEGRIDNVISNERPDGTVFRQ